MGEEARASQEAQARAERKKRELEEFEYDEQYRSAFLTKSKRRPALSGVEFEQHSDEESEDEAGTSGRGVHVHMAF